MFWLLLLGGATPAAGWTRLALARSEACAGQGCEVAVACPSETWPVACRSEAPQQGHSVWIANNSCVVRNGGLEEEDEIRANAACSSMYRTFVVPGSNTAAASCPPGSALERCFCEAEDCVPAAQILVDNTSACPAQAGAQALCLEGDTNWLLQNVDGLGFVKYCGWTAYQRPLNDPDFRNDTDCHAVMLEPQDGYVGACGSGECQGLEECVARCDLCPNCSAILYQSRDEGAIRCHMQTSIHVESLQNAPFPVPWSFYVNERNAGCQPDVESDALTSRGVRGFRLFSDLACSKELVPDQVFAVDGSGLVPLQGTWVPSCASAGRCHAGGVSLMATFAAPQVVRCAIVDAPEKFSRGWRLAKNSAVLSGLVRDLAQAGWLEVARSGASLGVRATWDGIAEVDGDIGTGALDSWNARQEGLEDRSGLLSILVGLLAAGLCFVAGAYLYLRPLLSGPAQPIRIEGRVAPVMLPPGAVLLEDEEGLSPDHIDVSAATFAMDPEKEETTQLTYVTSDVFAHLQGLLDFSHVTSAERAGATEAAAEVSDVAGDPVPLALQLRTAIHLQDSARSRRFAKQCAATRRKRKELKPISPELLSAAAAAKLELGSVLAMPDASVNESYLWYHASVRASLALAKGGRWSEVSEGGPDGHIRLTESCAQVPDVPAEPTGYYTGSRALLLCRVCVGKFCYVADASAEARRTVDPGEFDSILEDNASRQIYVVDADQVSPEFLVLCSQIGPDDVVAVPAPVHLETPIYWANLHRHPLEAPFHELLGASAPVRRQIQGLAEASTRHLVREVRCLESAHLWLQYLRHRRASKGDSPRAEVVLGDLLACESLLWLESDGKAVQRLAAGGILASSAEMLLLSEDLASCLRRGRRRDGASCVLLCRACHTSAAAPSMAAKAAASPSRRTGSGIRVRADHVYPEFVVDVEEKDTE